MTYLLKVSGKMIAVDRRVRNMSDALRGEGHRRRRQSWHRVIVMANVDTEI